MNKNKPISKKSNFSNRVNRLLNIAHLQNLQLIKTKTSIIFYDSDSLFEKQKNRGEINTKSPVQGFLCCE